MSQYTYDHNTAHILEPVQGYDLVSHMCFWEEIDASVVDAVPGTVMHRDPGTGKLKTGLLPKSMAQFLYSKQDTEDVLNSPVTANQMNITSIGTLSYGGFNTAPYRGEDYYSSNYGTNPSSNQRGFGNGISSNAPAVSFTNGVAGSITFRKQASAFTTFPGACGLELGSSEFARVTDQGATIDYNFDDPLTSPCAQSTYTAVGNPGTIAQNKFGGFLKKGTHYKDNICGILSRKPFRNENGTWMIRFWACHQPALDASTISTINTSGTTSSSTGTSSSTSGTGTDSSTSSTGTTNNSTTNSTETTNTTSGTENSNSETSTNTNSNSES